MNRRKKIKPWQILKRKFTKATGIPLTKAGLERKIGKLAIDLLTLRFLR